MCNGLRNSLLKGGLSTKRLMYLFFLIVFLPLSQRREVVTGNVEPTDSDCDWPSDEEEEDDEEGEDAEVEKVAVRNNPLSFS